MYNNHSHRLDDMPDSLDSFLAQIIGDIPELPSIPTTLPPLPLSSSAPSPVPIPTAPDDSDSQLTCEWVSSFEPLLICGAPLYADAQHACNHFRQVHDVRGNEKVVVCCQWQDCEAPPMQRGSMIRHVLSVHLALLRWRCEVCGRVFSRKGTGHACTGPTQG